MLPRSGTLARSAIWPLLGRQADVCAGHPIRACMLISVTLAPALDSALSVNGIRLDPKVMDWLELPDRIVKPVGVELFGLG